MVLKGITLKSPTAVGSGGFADIFQGLYKNELVALKRLKLYSRDPTIETAIDVSTTYPIHGGLIKTAKQEFRQEALVSSTLQHPNVQLFLGIDEDTFNFSICIVSPWQIYGNALDCLVLFDKLELPVVVDVWVCFRSFVVILG